MAVKQANVFWRLVPMLRRHRWAFPALIILGILQSLSEGVGIGLLVPLLHGLVMGQTAPPQGGVAGR